MDYLQFLTLTKDARTQKVRKISTALKQNVVGILEDKLVVCKSDFTEATACFEGDIYDYDLESLNEKNYWCRGSLAGFSAQYDDIPPPISFGFDIVGVKYSISSYDCEAFRDMLPVCREKHEYVGLELIRKGGFQATDGNLTFFADSYTVIPKNMIFRPCLWRLLAKFPDRYECFVTDNVITLESESMHIYSLLDTRDVQDLSDVDTQQSPNEFRVNPTHLDAAAASRTRTNLSVFTEAGELKQNIHFPVKRTSAGTAPILEIFPIRGDVDFSLDVHLFEKACTFTDCNYADIDTNTCVMENVVTHRLAVFSIKNN